MKAPQLLASLLLLTNQLAAQIAKPVQNIGTRRVQVEIPADGKKIVSNFFVPKTSDGDTVSDKSMLGGLYLWAGAIDPAGNLKISLQDQKPDFHNFEGGLRGIPNSAGVWKVTREQIEQHRADFKDNGKIDHRIPEIFAWPGAKNPYSLILNGFSMDSFSWATGAPFYDRNFDGEYRPEEGDFPEIFGYAHSYYKRPFAEIAWTPFFSVPKNTPFSKYLPLDCHAFFVSYPCDDAAFLDNQVVAHIGVKLVENEPMDSLFVGLLADANVGNPSDDYLGSNKGWGSLCFYNSDNFDEGSNGFGENPPAFGLDINGGFHSFDEFFAQENNAGTFYRDTLNYPPALHAPGSVIEFYNYLTGSWRDRTPMTFGGSGYNLDPTAKPTKYIFSGNPADLTEWSEVSAGSLPGKRVAILALGPAKMKPNDYGYFRFFLQNLPDGSIANSRATSFEFSDSLGLFLDVDFFPTDPFDSLACFKKSISTKNLLPKKQIQVSPNPATDEIFVEIGDLQVEQISIFDALGRQVFEKTVPIFKTNSFRLPTVFFPKGIYLLRIKTRQGVSAASFLKN